MEGKKQYNGRIIFFIIAIVAVFLAFAIRLMQYQIVDAEEYKEMAKGGFTSVQTVQAARGEILDRYGRPLATNKVGFDVILNEAYMPSSIVNTVIERIIKLMESQNQSWIDNLPISKEQPFTFVDGETNKAKIERLKKDNKINQDADANVTLNNLLEKYKLDEMQDMVMARKIAGVRYEMEQAGSSNTNPYTFSKNIPRDTVVRIQEYSQELPGVQIKETTTRQYTNGDLAPHVVGITGAISQEEYEEYNSKIKESLEAAYPGLSESELEQLYYDSRYGYNDTVGKSGLELAMEKELRGENGKMEIIADSKGNVLQTNVLKEAKPGNTLVLTIDKDLQKATIQASKDFLETAKRIYAPELGGKADKISTVAIDVKTGEVLALVNYPGYDLSEYYDKYTELSQDPLRPLYNSATMGTYMPGSIFKPVVGIGGFARGIIDQNRQIFCARKFTKFEDYQPSCLGYHRETNLKKALMVSCNYFFYEVGLEAGIDTIVDYAHQFGLGVETGIETGEALGHVSSVEYFEAARVDTGIKWTPGNVLQAAIGQLDNSFSPLQLAVYTATLANNGTRLRPHLVKSIESYNFEETVEKIEPEIMQQVSAPQEAFDAVRAGMLAASRDLVSGTARAYFGTYPIDVASKTGTPQATGGDDNATFIAYAPANDPQIAVAVVVEKGYSGQRGAPVARGVFDQFFSLNQKEETQVTEGQLLP